MARHALSLDTSLFAALAACEAATIALTDPARRTVAWVRCGAWRRAGWQYDTRYAFSRLYSATVILAAGIRLGYSIAPHHDLSLPGSLGLL